MRLYYAQDENHDDLVKKEATFLSGGNRNSGEQKKHGPKAREGKNWVKADSAKTKMRIARKKEKEHREQEMMR